MSSDVYVWVPDKDFDSRGQKGEERKELFLPRAEAGVEPGRKSKYSIAVGDI